MNLTEIQIRNYRSVKEQNIEVSKIGGSSTFCLFGINESGKSSILKAVALYKDGEPSYPEDYYDEDEPIQITFLYEIESLDTYMTKWILETWRKWSKDLAQLVHPISVEITVEFSPEEGALGTVIENIKFKKEGFEGFKLEGETPVKIGEDESKGDFKILWEEYFEEHMNKHFYNRSHDVVFWESSDQYLLLDEIDLASFAKSPKKISVPLTNSFLLAGIDLKKIETKISGLTSPARIRNLESKLSDTVTEHINTIWENHPIAIKFEINENKITLLVEDLNVKHKAKTSAQRSDGFRQFISFLLTVSAENLAESLKKKILLIDEPETHLHPKAQINLKDELINITSNKSNNIVFYATHSNYLIDKKMLKRNYKVLKVNNETTSLEQLESKTSSYSEVNYTVFDIPTTDYHNELYGFLEARFPKKLFSLAKDRDWYNEKTKKTDRVSLPMYIRHSIHHPENGRNKKFSERQLIKSIEILRKLKYNK